MGIYDRDYSRPDYEPHSRGHMQFRVPPLTGVVRKLLIINVAIFLACVIVKPFGNFAYNWFSVDTTTPIRMLQAWRLVWYQFLHDPGSAMHIIFNMIALYFLGPTLERYWGSKRFLKFYLSCGTAGGIFYIILVSAGALPAGMLVGASGAILGMLAACAILFPQFVVFLFLFPVPIRVAVAIFTVLYIFNIFTQGYNAGGDAAHLAGMAAGAAYVYLWPKLKTRPKKKPAPKRGDFEKKLRDYNQLQQEVDRILDKVNAHGIASLTKKEKQILSDATKLEQMKNKL